MTLSERLESYFGKKFVIFAPFIAYTLSQGQWDTALQALAIYGGLETSQNIYGMAKNGKLKVSGDTAELVNILKNLLKKPEPIPIPTSEAPKATVPNSSDKSANTDTFADTEETFTLPETPAVLEPDHVPTGAELVARADETAKNPRIYSEHTPVTVFYAYRDLGMAEDARTVTQLVDYWSNYLILAEAAFKHVAGFPFADVPQKIKEIQEGKCQRPKDMDFYTLLRDTTDAHGLVSDVVKLIRDYPTLDWKKKMDARAKLYWVGMSAEELIAHAKD